jgi:NAD(P)-dependent dehydrogenase (short-subunit alcohol dehydrogenase family)
MTINTPSILALDSPQDWRNHSFDLGPASIDRLRQSAIWVVGGGTGYGRAVAIACALLGAFVVVSGRRTDMLEETIAEASALGAAPDTLMAIRMDATDPASVAQAGALADGGMRARSGRSPSQPIGWSLVHCAALPQPPLGLAPLLEITAPILTSLINTNVSSALWTSRALLGRVRSGGAFRAVFFTSEAGWADTPGFGPYNLTKAALNSLAMSLAAEVSAARTDDPVQINVLVPGEARTEMNQGSEISAFVVVPMTLRLLSQPPPGPNGCFFHRDGRHLSFAYAAPFAAPLHND